MLNILKCRASSILSKIEAALFYFNICVNGFSVPRGIGVPLAMTSLTWGHWNTTSKYMTSQCIYDVIIKVCTLRVLSSYSKWKKHFELNCIKRTGYENQFFKLGICYIMKTIRYWKCSLSRVTALLWTWKKGYSNYICKCMYEDITVCTLEFLRGDIFYQYYF